MAYIEDPDIDLPGLMEHIKGPDFPTAGIIMGRSGIRAAYATGRGKITLRGRAAIEETKNGRTQIIITEIPYMVNKARLIENMAELVKDKRIEGITGLNDETNRKGMRIVVDIRKDANAQVILNQLYQYTQLQDTVGVIMLAIDHKVPKVMTLKQMIQKYVEFQDEVVRRRTQYDLKKAKERAHILEGLKKATDIVDELIATIRACKGGMAEAKAAIMEQFGSMTRRPTLSSSCSWAVWLVSRSSKLRKSCPACRQRSRIGRTSSPTTPGCWRSSRTSCWT